jgi:hypothetical protein
MGLPTCIVTLTHLVMYDKSVQKVRAGSARPKRGAYAHPPHRYSPEYRTHQPRRPENSNLYVIDGLQRSQNQRKRSRVTAASHTHKSKLRATHPRPTSSRQRRARREQCSRAYLPFVSCHDHLAHSLAAATTRRSPAPPAPRPTYPPRRGTRSDTGLRHAHVYLITARQGHPGCRCELRARLRRHALSGCRKNAQGAHKSQHNPCG